MSEPDRHEGIPSSVRDLLTKHIDTFEKLEVLVSLYRLRGTPLNEEQLGKELRLNSASLATALVQLATIGLLARDGESFAYPLAGTPRDECVKWLAETYERDRLIIVRLMTVLSFERIRSSSMTMFAEAFRIRDRPDG
jgi:hypothetical protein